MSKRRTKVKEGYFVREISYALAAIQAVHSDDIFPGETRPVTNTPQSEGALETMCGMFYGRFRMVFYISTLK